MRVSDGVEKWFPDSYVFAALGVIVVAIGALAQQVEKLAKRPSSMLAID